MANSKRVFSLGKMNLDTDSRLLPQGEYREAVNIDVINSEGADMGTVQNVFSNKQLTYTTLVAPIYDLGKFEDQKNHKLYWFTKDANGCYLFEWDDYNQIQSVVLADTRAENSRVLKLDKDHPITGIGKVYSQDGLGDLLITTDDNIEPLCINIERAKKYGVNGFEKEDIYLIKKPPAFAPNCTLILDGTSENYIEDKFFCFAYRYRYLDGEYSAFSSFSPYQFEAVGYDIDYFDCINKGMVNAFNAVNVDINTGDFRVTEIQVIAKKSNSNTTYIVETFNKELLGWADNQTESFNFYNNKIYTVLPEKELFRSFDNVPLKAKALTIANNIAIFGNYLEGFDLIDVDGNKVDMQHEVSVVSYDLDDENEFTSSVVNGDISDFQVNAPITDVFLKGYTLRFTITFEIDGIQVYSNAFQFIMEQDYESFTELVADPNFEAFIEGINTNIANNYNANNEYVIGSGEVIVENPYISVSYYGDVAHFILHPLTLDVDGDGSAAFDEIPTTFVASNTALSTTRTGIGKSCKTNRNYAVDIVYKDEFKRTTTVLTSQSNTIYIPQRLADQTNRLKLSIPHNPPSFAKYYSIVVKSQPLTYHQVMVTQYYTDGNFVWCLLQGDNKDKVKAGDLLIPKTVPNLQTKTEYITVLEIRDQAKDFLENNEDNSGNLLIEPSGVYMKIRPNGFTMNENDIDVYSGNKLGKNNTEGRPISNLDLFTTIDGITTTDLAIPQGSYMKISFLHERKFSDGWHELRYEKEFFANSSYDNLEDFINETLLNSAVNATYNKGNDIDISSLISVVRGVEVNPYYVLLPGDKEYTTDNIQITGNTSDKLFLRCIGNWGGRWKGNKTAYITASITVRIGAGQFIFETAPVESDLDLYYETQELEIVNDLHLGTEQDQTNTDPAIVELDFFNCYVFGNGVESYRVRDSLSGNSLNIDTRPNTTSAEPYKAIRRFADWTYSEAFIESLGINGINVFNLSTANFKEGDKQYGSIQILHTRDTDIVSIQERKAFKVLFGKDLLTMADGGSALSSIPSILGQKVAYLGDNGIGLQPTSFAVDSYRLYYFCPDSATPIRLSLDGTEEINMGMVDFFRDLTIDTFGSKIIGGYDPHKKMFVLSAEEPLTPEVNVTCGNIIYKLISEAFTYNFTLNDLEGDLILNYNIISGEVDIEVDYDNVVTEETGLTSTGTITIARTDTTKDLAVVTVTPVDGNALIQITNVCPTGVPLKVTHIILSDEEDLGETIVNRHSWGSSSLYSRNILFSVDGVNTFVTETGIEGIGKFPKRGELVTLQAFKNSINTGSYLSNRGNKMGYLVSTSNYTSVDINTILASATFISTSQTELGENSTVDEGSFTFTRPTNNHNLYLIWDYRDAPAITFTTTSTINNWSPTLVTNTGNTLTWVLEGGIELTSVANDPTFNLTTASGDVNGTVFNALGITELNVNTLDISSLNVKQAVNLTELYCYNNNISTLDVTSLTNLTKLHCYNNNNISILDVTSLTDLIQLHCGGNNISVLDVANLTNLTSLLCSDNNISTLDVTDLTSLTKLYCSSNNISTLDVTDLTNLTELECIFNNISTLNVTYLTNLTKLYCGGNNISVLNVTDLTLLTELYCFDNNISVLNVAPLINLTKLSCINNNISVLNVTNLTDLTFLECSDNNISDLDVTDLTSLTSLACSNNNISVLDVANLTNLTKLLCNSNIGITTLDVSLLTSLEKVGCANTSLNVTQVDAIITRLIDNNIVFSPPHVYIDEESIDLHIPDVAHTVSVAPLVANGWLVYKNGSPITV